MALKLSDLIVTLLASGTFRDEAHIGGGRNYIQNSGFAIVCYMKLHFWGEWGILYGPQVGVSNFAKKFSFFQF